MKLMQVHNDWRGSTFVLDDGGKELAVVTTNCDGALRGGHSHPYDTQIVVIKGAVDYVWNDGDPKSSKHARFDLSNPIITTPKSVPHLTVSAGESVMLELKNLDGEYKIDNYPPYRKLIEAGKPMNLEQVMKILMV